jgi:magnesium transporter
MKEEQDEDVQRLGAVEPMEQSYFQTTFWKLWRKRAPWLMVLFASGSITTAVLKHHHAVLDAVTELTYYLTLLVATGGNSGSQSATLVIRGLATGEILLGDWWRVFVREFGQGIVLGVGLATLGLLRVWWAGGTPGMAITVGVTVIAIALMGCTVGAMLPLLLRRIGLDPATSSAPFITTLIDVLGIMLYISVARVVLAEVLAAAGV